jgi:hypothetical protein
VNTSARALHARPPGAPRPSAREPGTQAQAGRISGAPPPLEVVDVALVLLDVEPALVAATPPAPPPLEALVLDELVLLDVEPALVAPPAPPPLEALVLDELVLLDELLVLDEPVLDALVVLDVAPAPPAPPPLEELVLDELVLEELLVVAVHGEAVPAQTPFVQTSFCVQGSPSSQGTPVTGPQVPSFAAPLSTLHAMHGPEHGVAQQKPLEQ